MECKVSSIPVSVLSAFLGILYKNRVKTKNKSYFCNRMKKLVRNQRKQTSANITFNRKVQFPYFDYGK